MLNKITFSLLALALTAACTHSSYKPEVTGPGAESSKGGVVYSIPPKDPILKMKLVSLGVNKDDLLLVRMYFKRMPNDKTKVTFDPKEQVLTLPDSQTPILPAHVHAAASAKPKVALASQEKQAVEIQYQVDKRSRDKYPYFEIHWALHYEKDGKDQVERQIARFDREDKRIPQGPDAEYDPDYPYAGDVLLPNSSEWNIPGALWW